jgi:hypothetical protein
MKRKQNDREEISERKSERAGEDTRGFNELLVVGASRADGSR